MIFRSLRVLKPFERRLPRCYMSSSSSESYAPYEVYEGQLAAVLDAHEVYDEASENASGRMWDTVRKESSKASTRAKHQLRLTGMIADRSIADLSMHAIVMHNIKLAMLHLENNTFGDPRANANLSLVAVQSALGACCGIDYPRVAQFLDTAVKTVRECLAWRIVQLTGWLDRDAFLSEVRKVHAKAIVGRPEDEQSRILNCLHKSVGEKMKNLQQQLFLSRSKMSRPKGRPGKRSACKACRTQNDWKQLQTEIEESTCSYF